jgi:hypothetical protein
MRARDDVVQGNAFDWFAHQFPDAFGQRAVENQIGAALAVKPLAIERGPFFEVRGRVVEDRGAFLKYRSTLSSGPEI